VVALAVSVLPITAAFQLVDGIQVVSFGILRGAGDLRLPALANILGYWCFGLPLAALFAFGLGWGLPGLWVGLACGIAAVAGLLLLRVRWIVRRGATRLALDA
jgi:MATE family multidrug resistance protein